jgi:hypothetical protein
MRKRLGFIYVAKRPCGKVSAMSWDDDSEREENAESVAKWIERGDAVERIERFDGDPMPEWICRSGCRDCAEQKGGA